MERLRVLAWRLGLGFKVWGLGVSGSYLLNSAAGGGEGTSDATFRAGSVRRSS